MARGQTIDDVLAALPPATKAERVRYWFDDAPASLATLQQMKGEQQIDASSLVEGLHTLHLQIEDENGAVCSPRSSVFLKFNSVSTIAPAAQLRYWFDDIPSVTTVSATSGLQPLDVSALIEGLHTLHFQVVDVNGKVGHVMSSVFLKFNHVTVSGNVQAKNLLYWFDDAADGMVSLPMTAGVQQIDASALVEGLHTLHYQVVCSDGSLTSAHSSVFLKMNFELAQTKAQRLRYWFDDLATVQETEVLKGAQLLDASMLTEGLHTLHYQLVDETGAVCSPKSAVFLKMNVDVSQPVAKTQRYWFDDDPTTMHEQPVTAGTQMLDVEGLLTGLHTLHYQLTDETGRLAPPRSAVFVKMPERTIAEGENRITQYMYWTNDYSQDNVKVVLPQPASSYQLISLLPTVKAPIRSSMFHFEVTDGQPTIYAKNDIHVRFYDAAGYWADDARQFIDYSVNRAVDDATALDATQTFDRPAENEVKWFSFEAEKGDSIAFSSSQATSLQVFSPTSKEVYAASADQSVKFGGCHVWEDGTYYVAVHDVTGTKSNVTLDYMHMDRYDVVAQDIYTVGNGGASTLTFQGNGFDELESVNLAFDGQTIQADSIFHESNVTSSVRFNFTEAHVGKYTATFTFKEGTKVVDNCVAVEEATPIVINETVRFDKQYLRTRTNEYVINLRNEGNSTAYDVPVVIGIFTPEHNQLNKVLIEGHDYYNQWKRMLPDLFTPAFEDSLQTLYTSEGLKPLFIKLSDVEYVSGNPAMHRAKLYVNLRPNTTETFKVCINASTTAHVFVWAPEQWETQASTLLANRRIRKTVIDDARCGIATAHNSRCEQNAMMIEQGQEPIYTNIDCSDMAPPPGCPNPGGGSSTPVNSFDPNEIYGYTAESGSRYMTDKVQQVNYRIEFENDPEFATASAHVVEIRDTLNAKYFDLDSYAPTGIKIGDRTELLDGKPQFVRTIDMRPQINAIAQVEGFYNRMKGIVTYRFTSIDPMTMEPTDDVMQGFLPVNVDGTSGIGEVSYNVNLLKTFADGTQITNRASIVFDTNEPILTPVWQNTIDAVSPVSKVTEVVTLNDSTARVRCEGTDERSGVWRYEVYAQYGSVGTWEKVGTCNADSAWIDFPMEEHMSYGFCALAIDSAGNVEVKDMLREAELVTYVSGDANGDGVIDIEDVVTAVSHYLGEDTPILFRAADVNGDGVIDIEDVVGIREIYLGAATPQAARLRSTTKRQRLRTVMQQ